jgi:hypothetical protein
MRFAFKIFEDDFDGINLQLKDSEVLSSHLGFSPYDLLGDLLEVDETILPAINSLFIQDDVLI